MSLSYTRSSAMAWTCRPQKKTGDFGVAELQPLVKFGRARPSPVARITAGRALVPLAID
jgi:hypothetical protein